MTLQLRLHKIDNYLIPPTAQPDELQADSEQHTNGLPWLYGEFSIPMPQPLVLVLRIHNQAGIPIIEGWSRIEAGQRQFTFHELRAFGIEAYAHIPDTERLQIVRRIWSRRAYGVLTFLLIR